ncbi:Histamine H4 receptor [Holothuria leucospilota]|uniref:Histamine H4 receptor n=1 Tax=Holothuria leucospilota TaxID=206669 RepID=A0A9Q1CNH5_HOLLE|nr:Histamine H4 receptor [Holothuria leucospilota]
MFATTLSVIGCIAVLGNGLIVLAHSTKKEIRKVYFNNYILNLAIVDFMIGTVAIPVFVRVLTAKEGIDPYRSVIPYLYWATTILFYASVVTTVLMSYDRYRLVSDPLKYQVNSSRKKSVRMVVSIWCVSATSAILINSSVLISASYAMECSKTWFARLLGIFVVFYNYLFPLFAIISLNIFVFYKLKVRSRMFYATATSAASGLVENRAKPETGCLEAREMDTIHGKEEIQDDMLSSLKADPISNFENVATGEHKHTENIKISTVNNESEMGIHFTLDGSSANLKINPYSTPSQLNSSQLSHSSKVLALYTNESESVRMRKLNQAGRQLFLIVSAFIMCWLPFQTFLLSSGKRGWNFEGKHIWLLITEIFFCANSAINSFLYLLTSKRHKRQVHEIVCLKAIRRH